MNRPIRARELPYEARARIADNLFLQRKRAGYSQEALGERAMVSADRISAAENGRVAAMLDTYVRPSTGGQPVSEGRLLVPL
jgi:hypothetical protein